MPHNCASNPLIRPLSTCPHICHTPANLDPVSAPPRVSEERWNPFHLPDRDLIVHRILIVDVDRDVLARMSEAFCLCGYDVRTAAEAWEAIVLCVAEPFDAILSEVQLPQMNGYELVRWAFKNRPNIRCVLMTATQEAIACEGCSPLTFS
jgi:CheY-like chemotaxis protein